MKRRTIELRSGTWEWSVVDPDDPRARGRTRTTRVARTPVPAGGDGTNPEETPAEIEHDLDPELDPEGSPPLPRRRIELRSTAEERHRMCVRVPPHLGNAGDEAAVRMLALNPDRRTVVDPAGTMWALWPEHREDVAAPPASLAAPRHVRAAHDGERPRKLSLPEGLALGQLTDQEILDLLA